MSSKHGTLILVQGLAGSGKSHLIELLKHDFLIEENFALDEARNIVDLASELRCGHCCIVSERKYRSDKERNDFIAKVLAAVNPQPPPSIRVICFENDINAANHNCRKRTNKAHDRTGEGHIVQNEGDTLDYEIPPDAIVVQIHRI